jgi:surface protein
MFYGCEKFNKPVHTWNVSSVIDMSRMFCMCYNFSQSLEEWDFSSVENTESMVLGTKVDEI